MQKISIIVPVYNAKKYLKKCVDSILNQTYQNIELILIDDGSTDISGDICDEYAIVDKRVKVIHQENAGVSAARNAGLDRATGNYLTVVDSDDYIESDMYFSMMQIAEQYDCDVVMCDCLKEYGNYSEIYTHDIRQGFYNKNQLEKEYFPHLLMMENVEYPATISNYLCLFKNKKNLPRYVEGIRYSEDLLFGAQLIYMANSFYYVKGEAYYHYNCMNQQSTTHTFVPNKWNDYILLYRAIKDSFGNDEIFNFKKQIDLCLLFFLYNTIGEICSVNDLAKEDKLKKIYSILKYKEVREMFKRLRIIKLPISYKQKIVTWIYKYQKGIGILMKYYE